MFQSLRINQQLYILYKESTPRIEIGTVTSVTQPVFKFPTATTLGQPQEQVVDVYVSVGGAQRQFQQLPANKESADFGTGNMFVTMNRDAMNAEIMSLKNASEEHIRRVDEERQKISAYNTILQQINPEFAERQRQERDIDNLKQQVAQIAKSNSNLEGMFAKILEKLESGEKQQKTK